MRGKNCCFLMVLLSIIPIGAENYQSFTEPAQVLHIVEKYLPKNPVIVEAGAYDGSDSVGLARHWPCAVVHSFEPIPELYKILQEKTSEYARIHTYNTAIGDTIGTALMHVSEHPCNPGVPSQSSSLLAPKEHLNYSPIVFKKQITVPITTFDAWADAHKIDHIDFMWLDMQGYEQNALMASPCVMSKVKAVLTEVEFVEAYEGQFLYADVKKWFEERGFVMIALNTSCGWFGDALFVKKECLMDGEDKEPLQLLCSNE